MIIIKAYGGLGNQMFQYAFGRALSLKYNREMFIDKSYFNKENYPFHTHPYYPYKLDIYNIENDFVSPNISKFINIVKRKRLFHVINPIIGRLNLYKFIPEYFPEDNFSIAKLKNSKNAFLEGYWQKYSIIEEFRDIIIINLTLKKEISKVNKEILNKIDSLNSISIHIRQGDYITNPTFNAYYEICPMKYYEDAMDYIAMQVDNPVFFIFSDSIDWVKNNMHFKYLIIYVDNKGPDHEDLYLMSKCKHNIIANSSFSWWGAWLNENPDKIVIAPKKWFKDPIKNNETKDLLPNSWIII